MRKTFLLAAATFVAGALGCSGYDGAGPGAGSLAVDSTRPATGATGIEAGTTVRAYFNEALNPSTVTSATFTLSTGASDLASQVAYDAGRKAAVLSGPILPGKTYDATVLTGIRDVGGTPLPAAHAWSFTTRTWQPVAVDQTGTVGRYSSLAVDGTGQVHVSYFDDTNSELKYATCAASCTTAATWQTVTVDQGGGSYNSLAVDGTGGVHVSYRDGTDLKYASCAANCMTAASWATVVVDQGGDLGAYSSLALDGSGRVHVSYSDGTNVDLKYATCAGSCTTAANWQTVAIDQSGFVGVYTSLAVDGSGRVHVSYQGDADLKYATCPAGCTVAANWTNVAVDQTGYAGAYSSLAVDGSGRLHVSYFEETKGDLRYATCAADCSTAANWQTVAADEAGDIGYSASLAVDGSGRLHVSYADFTNGDLKYATCAADCTSPSSWQTTALDHTGNLGGEDYTSLAVDASGGVHVSYFDDTNADLKYIR